MDTTAKLVLFPHGHDLPTAGVDDLAGLLRDIGLVTGETMELEGRRHHLLGDGLFDLVTFLGCAPSLELAPPASGQPGPMDFVSLCPMGPFPVPRLRRGRNTTAPPCPACGSRDPGWRWQGATGSCNACGAAADAAALPWRKSAAVGSFFLDLWAIYPAEAVPAPALLEHLAGFSGGPWRYGYLLDEIEDAVASPGAFAPTAAATGG